MIQNWLTIGLLCSWCGFMMHAYVPRYRDGMPAYQKAPWWVEVLSVLLWPLVIAAGIIAAIKRSK